MHRPSNRTLARYGCLLALSAPALAGTAASVRAQDGLGGFFDRLFAPAAPVYAPVEAVPFSLGEDRRIRRAAKQERRADARYASLSDPDSLSLKIGSRQEPIDMKDGATAALLQDRTLEPGDIVILPQGAHVFVGSPGRRHAMRDFEAAGQSPRIDRRTRVLLAAMVAPRGAMPAAEARRTLRRAKGLDTGPQPAEVQRAAEVRMIAPWTGGR